MTVNQSQKAIWAVKPNAAIAGDDVPDHDDGGQRRDDLDHEHDRVADQASAG